MMFFLSFRKEKEEASRTGKYLVCCMYVDLESWVSNNPNVGGHNAAVDIELVRALTYKHFFTQQLVAWTEVLAYLLSILPPIQKFRRYHDADEPHC